jgi:rhodanese-related sulfurtransferase
VTVTEMPRKEVPPPLELVKSRIVEVLPPDAESDIGAGEVVVVDTRDPEKFEAGHLDGAVNVPVGDNAVDSHSAEFSERFADATGGKPALLYCNSGNRSARAADALTNEHGVEGVRSLIGGITLWNDLGLPVDGEVAADEETDDDEEGEG